MRIAFTIPGEPVAKGRPRFARIGKFVKTYTPKKSLNFEQAVTFYAQEAMDRADVKMVQDEPVSVVIDAFFTRPKSRRRMINAGRMTKRVVKPDFDNIAKSCADGMNGVVYRDDSLIWECLIRKYEVDDRPRTEIIVESREKGS